MYADRGHHPWSAASQARQRSTLATPIRVHLRLVLFQIHSCPFAFRFASIRGLVLRLLRLFRTHAWRVKPSGLQFSVPIP
jgi:hypothetical protein